MGCIYPASNRSNVRTKKDIFTICAPAAGAFAVEEATVKLDNPTDSSIIDTVIDQIPQLALGRQSRYGIEAILKKEIGVLDNSRRRGRSLKEADRRRLEASIPPNAHRGLRMLCSDELLDLQIECPVDTSGKAESCRETQYPQHFLTLSCLNTSILLKSWRILLCSNE